MKVLDGLNLTMMDSSFMRVTGMEIMADSNTIIAGTRTTTGTRTAAGTRIATGIRITTATRIKTTKTTIARITGP